MPMTNARRPVAVDLFAGAGGLSLGLEQAGFDIALSVDRDGYHTAAHERNFPYGKSICAPIQELTVSLIESLVGSLEVDLVCGGPPCQGFSSMGIRDVNDPRNSLVGQFVRIVREVAPRAFLMENVPGMNSGSTAPIFERAVKDLESAGYRITQPVRVLNAANFGVPQSRERLFVLGLRNDFEGTIPYPVGSAIGQPTRPNVREALGGLPELHGKEFLYRTDICPYSEFKIDELHPYAKVLLGIQDDPSDFSRPRNWDRTSCSGCMLVKHDQSSIDLYKATQPGTMVPGHKLSRLNPDGLSPTLRAGSESEHGSYTAPRPIHFLYPRCITAREAARLHGYPDWFRFYPTKSHAARQIGNSVCPPVGRALGREILTAIGYNPLKTESPVELSDSFTLPDNRPKQQPRITQSREWPKIVMALFESCCDENGCLIREDFCVKDIEEAYRATNAKMPRNPASRFLADIARSRNRMKIMSELMSLGYTILVIDKEKGLGRFVSKETPLTIEKKGQLTISSKAIAKSVEIDPLDDAKLTDESICLYSNIALETLLPNRNVSVDLETDLLGQVNGFQHSFNVCSGAKTSQGRIVAGDISRVGQLDELLRIVAKYSLSEILVLAPLTNKHFAGILLACESPSCREVARAVFCLREVDTKALSNHSVSSSFSN
jgi:DNA (cytosine-5)-methyltransferase 1